jgi:quinol monooxygenase YgiN
MLIRIVRLTLDPAHVDAFHDHFESVAPRIRQFDGCEHLELWTDATHPNVVITHSHWTDGDALQAYRASTLFRSVWATVKPLFAARPQAFSAEVAHSASEIEAALPDT